MKAVFYLKRPDSKTPTALFARISYKGYQLKYYITEQILPKYWNKETHRAKETSKFREYPEFNTRLNNIEASIKNLYRKYQNDHEHAIPAPDTLKELLDKEFKKEIIKQDHNHSFFGFMEEFIEQTKSGVRIHPKTGKPYSKGTAKVYVTAYKHLQHFQSLTKKKIDFSTIDVSFYMDFNEYLIKTVKLSTNAIGKNIQVLKLIMGEALERGLHSNIAYKSKRFTAVSEKSDSIYLSAAEIKEIESLDL